MMEATELVFKSPYCPPFSKGEFSPQNFNPCLEKRGRGDFWRE
jgi:hypothetical protein